MTPDPEQRDPEQREVKPSQHVAEIFASLISMPPDVRDAALVEQCAGDESLIAELRSLLKHHSDPAICLDEPALGHVLRRTPQSRKDCNRAGSFPASIGGYRILGVLGEGGMGIVYRAEQDRPRRTVALKVIRPECVSDRMLRRFEREQEALGRLQHPGIAQIFEAGVHLPDDGSAPEPFFAMELVEGEPLTDYARNRQLGTRDRLHLVRDVCLAVEHAHQKGVIHRDLKPANILVTESSITASTPATGQGSRTHLASFLGTPKVLDFGVARAIDSDVRSTTLRTDVGQLIGTLAYMSPEQVAGEQELPSGSGSSGLDVRSDVYALGVICFELLSDRLPYDLDGRSIPEAIRIIREEEPKPLSSIDRTFRGDLETIVGKALEKDCERRYHRASELAADIDRYLQDQPIVARRPSAIYQFRKFARRNRALVTGVVALFALLIGATALSSTLLVRALHAEHEMLLALSEAREAKTLAEASLQREEAERAEAERQARIARAVSDFVTEDLLGKADPYRGHGPDVPLRIVLDQASEVIDSMFDDEPRIRAAIHTTLGRTYESLALYEQAERHLRIAIDLFADELGPDSLETIKARNSLGLALVMAWRNTEAEQFVRETLAMVEQTLGPRHEQVAHPLNSLGILLKRRGDFAQAEEHYRLALDIARKTLGPHHLTTLAIMNNLVIVLADQRKHDEAEAMGRELLELRRTVYGPQHPSTAYALLNLGHVLWTRSTTDEEIQPLWQEAYEIYRDVFGEEHEHTLRPLYGLALLRGVRGEYAEAERLHREVLERRLRILPEDHNDVLLSKQVLAGVIRRQGPHRYAEAEAIYRQILPARQRLFGVAHPRTQRTRASLLELLRDRGDDAAVIEFQREWLEALRDASEEPDASPHLINMCAWHHLTVDVLELRDPAFALAAAERAVALTNRQNVEMLDTLALALSENHRVEEAIDVQREAVAILHEIDPVNDDVNTGAETATLLAMQRLASVYKRADRCEDAETMLSEIIRRHEQAQLPSSVQHGLVLRDRARCLLALERLDEAERTLRQSFDILSTELGRSHDHVKHVVQLIVETYDALEMADLVEIWQANLQP